MYQSLRSNNFEVEIENEDYMFESDLICPDFEKYSQWGKLIKKIISI
jgi:hypothetical protein